MFVLVRTGFLLVVLGYQIHFSCLQLFFHFEDKNHEVQTLPSELHGLDWHSQS